MHALRDVPATCPTYDTTKRERNSPRGRIALMRAVADGDLEVTREFAEEMSYCLGCLACQTACPAGVNYAELFETARSDIETQGAHPGVERKFWRAVTLGFLFVHPRALRAAGWLLRVYQRTGAEAFVRRSRLLRLLPPALRRLGPQTPRMAPAFSTAHRRREELTGPPVSRRVLRDESGPRFSEVNRDTRRDPCQRLRCRDAAMSRAADRFTPQRRRGSANLARRMIELMLPTVKTRSSPSRRMRMHLRRYGPLSRRFPFPRSAKRGCQGRESRMWRRLNCRATGRRELRSRDRTYHESGHLVHERDSRQRGR